MLIDQFEDMVEAVEAVDEEAYEIVLDLIDLIENTKDFNESTCITQHTLNYMYCVLDGVDIRDSIYVH